MIDMIVWSFDRSLQLHLLLKSIQKYCSKNKVFNKIYVLYKYSLEEFKKGYDKLININDFNNDLYIEYILENNFNNDIKSILINKSESDYILGNSDDNVFIDYVDFNNNEYLLEDNEVAFSLRLGKLINICQPANNLVLETPQFIMNNHLLKWDWTKSDKRGCWGYPHPCDSNIYLKDYLINLIKDNNKFNNPGDLENHMNYNRNFNKPYMKCFVDSKLISICANKVNNTTNNINSNISTEYLNKLWLSNYIIKLPNIKNNNACHIMYNYEFEEVK